MSAEIAGEEWVVKTQKEELETEAEELNVTHSLTGSKSRRRKY